MAFTRSASGPGGLSINTSGANLFGSATSQPPAAGGLFGSTSASTSQPAQSGGLFGTASTSQQPQSTGSLFGSTTSQPQRTGGLFGSAQPLSQPQQTGGLFGSTTTISQPQQTGGLFGSIATSQPQQTGGMFGSTPAAQQQQQPQQQAGGLFGNTATQQQRPGGLFGSTTSAQPQQGGGMFGSLQNTQPAQQGGLFGASTQQQQQQQQQQQLQQQQQQQPQQTTGGLFGGSVAGTGGALGQNRPGGSLFGSLNQPTAQPQQTNAFGQSVLGSGLTLGQSTQQQQVVPGVRIDVSNIRPTTRFNDLQEDLQNRIAEIDRAIQGFIAQKNELDAFMPAHGEQLSCIPTDVNFVGRKASGVESALTGDAVAVKQLRELVKVDADNARLSFKAVDNLKLPTAYHQAGLWSTRGQQGGTGGGAGDADGESNSVLVDFFSRTADEMGDTMKKFEGNLTEIELHLHAVQGNVLEQLQRVAATPKDGVQNRADEKVVELAAVLRDFEESILQVAGVVGGAREGMTSLQLGELLGNGSNGVR